jgi:hypothetical protein
VFDDVLEREEDHPPILARLPIFLAGG